MNGFEAVDKRTDAWRHARAYIEALSVGVLRARAREAARAYVDNLLLTVSTAIATARPVGADVSCGSEDAQGAGHTRFAPQSGAKAASWIDPARVEIDWIEMVTDSQPYYWRRSDRVVQWLPPAGIKVVWCGRTDPEHGFYFFHKHTHESRRELPDPLALPPPSDEWVEASGPRGNTFYFNTKYFIAAPRLPKGGSALAGSDMPLLGKHPKYLDSDQGQWIRVGWPCFLNGLTTHRRLNGQVGMVWGWTEDKVQIQLPTVLGGGMKSVSAECVRPLPDHSIVQVTGLQDDPGTPGVNCACGWVVGRDQQTLQYFLRIEDQPVMRISGNNLLAMSRILDIDLTEGDARRQCAKNWRRERRCTFFCSQNRKHFFALSLPPSFWDSLQRRRCPDWPLMVYMHGSGGGSMMAESKKSIRSAGLTFAIENFVAVSPECEWTWKESPRPWVLELIRHMRAADWIDHTRVYLTGCSMGGMGTWELGAMAPELFAAIVPIAAHHKPELRYAIAERLRGKVVRVVHARNDDTCPMSNELPLWNLLQEQDRDNAHFSRFVYSDCSHTSVYYRAFCDDPKLFQWLLQLECRSE